MSMAVGEVEAEWWTLPTIERASALTEIEKGSY